VKQVPNSAGEAIGWPAARAGWTATVILTITYTLAYVDRSVLALLVEPLKSDFELSDTQVSLLGGAAFALFYVFMGLPLGRLADRSDRRRLIAVGVAMWSATTAACGLAGSFAQLFFLRVMVGVGEASLTPAALSLISDYFPPEKRRIPLSFYMSAVALGSGLAYVAGGAVIGWSTTHAPIELPLAGQLAPWQLVFIVVGLPGLLLAWPILSIAEPARRERASGNQDDIPFAQVLRFVFVTRWATFVPIFAGFGLLALHSIALQLWLPAYFIRQFGWSEGQIGLTFGSIILVAATAGMVGGGWFSAHLEGRQGRASLLLAPLWMTAIMVPLAIALTLVPSSSVALLLLVPVTALSYGVFAIVPAILYAVTPNELRGQIIAIYAFTNNVIGLMVGGSSVALITDLVFRDPSKVGYSLALTGVIVLPAAMLLIWAALPAFRKAS
jgi:MFS family permease